MHICILFLKGNIHYWFLLLIQICLLGQGRMVEDEQLQLSGRAILVCLKYPVELEAYTMNK